MTFFVGILNFWSDEIQKVSKGVSEECAMIDKTIDLLGGVLEDIKKD
jgi:hypothetical protein